MQVFDVSRDAEVERALVSAVLSREGLIERVMDEEVLPRHFSDATLRAIMQSAVTLTEEGKTVTPVTVIDHLRASGRLEEAGGPKHVSSLVSHTHLGFSVEGHSAQIRSAAMYRYTMEVSRAAIETALERAKPAPEILDDLSEDITYALSRGTGYEPADKMAACQRLIQGLEDVGPRGLLTGFADLDKRLAGLRAGEHVVVAARPAMGKTAFGLGIARNVATTDVPVAYFSMEMSVDELLERYVGLEVPLSFHPQARESIRFDKTSESQMSDLSLALARFHKHPILIDDTPSLTLTDIRQRSRRLVRKHGVQLIVVDYMQLMDTGEKEYEGISAISKGLKNLARELEVPIISLSQLNRDCEKRNPPRPIMADLRGSGAIEQDANSILFLYRQEYYDTLHGREPSEDDVGVGEVIVGKNRRGPPGSVRLHFDKERSRFHNLSRDYGYCP